MWTLTFWKQTAERMIAGAFAGAGAAYIVGMDAFQVETWQHIGQGAVWGAFVAAVASLAGSRAGDPTSPLGSAPVTEATATPPQDDEHAGIGGDY